MNCLIMDSVSWIYNNIRTKRSSSNARPLFQDPKAIHFSTHVYLAAPSFINVQDGVHGLFLQPHVPGFRNFCSNPCFSHENLSGKINRKEEEVSPYRRYNLQPPLQLQQVAPLHDWCCSDTKIVYGVTIYGVTFKIITP